MCICLLTDVYMEGWTRATAIRPYWRYEKTTENLFDLLKVTHIELCLYIPMGTLMKVWICQTDCDDAMNPPCRAAPVVTSSLRVIYHRLPTGGAPIVTIHSGMLKFICVSKVFSAKVKLSLFCVRVRDDKSGRLKWRAHVCVINRSFVLKGKKTQREPGWNKYKK